MENTLSFGSAFEINFARERGGRLKSEIGRFHGIEARSRYSRSLARILEYAKEKKKSPRGGFYNPMHGHYFWGLRTRERKDKAE